jgi:hypothetical protein
MLPVSYWNLVAFNAENDLVARIKVAGGYQSMQQHVAFYESIECKCFTVFIHGDYNTCCFNEKGSCSNQEVHNFLKAHNDTDLLWENLD